MFCKNCGNEVDNKAEICPKCGVRIATEPTIPMVYCRKCGNQIHESAEICPKCGVRNIKKADEKDPFIAILASFFIIGLGQAYNKQVEKGIIFFISAVIITILVNAIPDTDQPASGIVALALIGLWIYNIYDAYKRAKEINAGQL